MCALRNSPLLKRIPLGGTLLKKSRNLHHVQDHIDIRRQRKRRTQNDWNGLNLRVEVVVNHVVSLGCVCVCHVFIVAYVLRLVKP